MPERVVELAAEVSQLTSTKLHEIAKVADATRLLAINARIQAAQAGDHGRGFGVVAGEVGNVASNVKALSEELNKDLRPRVDQLDMLGRQLVADVRGKRLADLARTAVELIDRNLYERSCDVRWWATDSAPVAACESPDDAALCTEASNRLGVILDSYTVYLDLWVADANGRVIAHGRPGRYSGVIGTDVSRERWFREAMATHDGSEYVVDDVALAPRLGNATVATYATAIRRGGKVAGEPVGALGIFFDWGPQSHDIVAGLRLTDDERDRTRAMLLDHEHRVIASSDGRGILSEKFPLDARGSIDGSRTLDDGSIVGFSLTPGYETYEGLGWYGVVLQRPR